MKSLDSMDDDDSSQYGGFLQGLSTDGGLGMDLAEALRSQASAGGGGYPAAPEWPAQLPPEFPQLPSSVCGMPSEIFESLCKQMMGDIHRNILLTPDEKEAKLRPVELRIPSSSSTSTAAQGSPRSLRLLEDPSGSFSAGATGAVLWPAAGALVEWLDREVDSIAEKTGRPVRVVELGAGIGAVGLFLKMFKGCEVVLTEMEEALPLLRCNVRQHFPNDDGPEVMSFNWSDRGHLAGVQRRIGEADLVVGSDITYRPEHLSELLVCAQRLLGPGGKFLLTLQDRSGEAASLEDSVARGCGDFQIASQTEAGPVGLLAVEKSTLGGSHSQLGVDPPKVWCYELVQAETKKNDASLGEIDYFQSPADIEAEFARLTGIKVDPILPDGKWLPRPAREKTAKEKREEAAKKKASGESFRDGIVREFRERGMSAYLCDVDEELKEKIDALPPHRRPRSEVQRERLAEAYYTSLERGEPLPPELTVNAFDVAPESPDAIMDGISADDLAALDAISSREHKPSSPSKPSRATADSEASTKDPAQANNCGAQAKTCIDGLEWSVEIDEAESKIAAIVTFSEDIWYVLQGASGGGSFKDAVDFELAEKQLRVRHVGATVLELILPQQVDPTAAAAKICGKRRRVTVKAPLM